VVEWICQSWPIKVKSEMMTNSLREMVGAARKYNTQLSSMRVPLKLRLDMPAFYHPFTRSHRLQVNSKVMECLRGTHRVRQVRDLVKLADGVQLDDLTGCTSKKPRGESCQAKAKELINRLPPSWNPNKETPQKHGLWHTPLRKKKFEKLDPVKDLVLFNPDTRAKHDLLGNIRIFGKTPGYKARDRERILQEQQPARISDEVQPSGVKHTVSTDGSAMNNGWENATAGIGAWYADESEQNITIKLQGTAAVPASNNRAELGAILETLRQNQEDDLVIESDSLGSLRAICSLSESYEDKNWTGVQNSDLLKSILIQLRTRPACTSFKWVKGHADNYGNNQADSLADRGRTAMVIFNLDDKQWVSSHPALQDGTRLQALETKDIYRIILFWYTRDKKRVLHQEVLDDAKEKVELFTGLRPTNERLLKSIKKLAVPLRLRDHMRNMLIGRIKCGSYWINIPGYDERGYCSFCKKRAGLNILETEEHIWLECPYNGRRQAWDYAQSVWELTTPKLWPDISIGLIRGASAIAFKEDFTRDAERLRILISMTLWAIWKSRNKNTITNQDVDARETKELLKTLIEDLIRKSWNATRFMDEDRRMRRQAALRSLWADKQFVYFDPKKGPTFNTQTGCGRATPA
jgi:ribonuclease HI